MNKNFILSGLIATVFNLLSNAGADFFFLKGVFEAHPPVSEAFLKHLHRPPNQLVGWAMAISAFKAKHLETCFS
jgi:hypothetical protein